MITEIGGRLTWHLAASSLSVVTAAILLLLYSFSTLLESTHHLRPNCSFTGEGELRQYQCLPPHRLNSRLPMVPGSPRSHPTSFPAPKSVSAASPPTLSVACTGSNPVLPNPGWFSPDFRLLLLSTKRDFKMLL